MPKRLKNKRKRRGRAQIKYPRRPPRLMSDRPPLNLIELVHKHNRHHLKGWYWRPPLSLFRWLTNRQILPITRKSVPPFPGGLHFGAAALRVNSIWYPIVLKHNFYCYCVRDLLFALLDRGLKASRTRTEGLPQTSMASSVWDPFMQERLY